MTRRAILAVAVAACGDGRAPLGVDGPGTSVSAPPPLVGASFGSPVADATAISSTFGPRWKTSASRYDFHPGIDYFGALGTPVVAIGDGTVEDVYPVGSVQFPDGGNVVVVRHAISAQTFHGIEVDRVFAVYLHLATIDVSAGATVTAGQTVGTMGMTGDTDFVHLHFETRVETVCSLPYQTQNPSASCAQYGFDPHVHPFLFVPDDGAAAGFTIASLDEPNAYRYVSAALDLDVIATDRGTIGFSTREGLDATSLDALDNFDRGWIRIVPEPFTSSSSDIAYELHFAEPLAFLELRLTDGTGLRY
jgi:hypothetical protein